MNGSQHIILIGFYVLIMEAAGIGLWINTIRTKPTVPILNSTKSRILVREGNMPSLVNGWHLHPPSTNRETHIGLLLTSIPFKQIPRQASLDYRSRSDPEKERPCIYGRTTLIGSADPYSQRERRRSTGNR